MKSAAAAGSLQLGVSAYFAGCMHLACWRLTGHPFDAATWFPPQLAHLDLDFSTGRSLSCGGLHRCRISPLLSTLRLFQLDCSTSGL